MTLSAARCRSIALILALVAPAVACSGGDSPAPKAMALRVGTFVWPEPTTSAAPITELGFGEQVTPGRDRVRDPADSTRQFVRVSLTSGESGWVLEGDLVFDAVPAAVTRDVPLRSEADPGAPVGESIPRLTPVAVSSTTEPSVFVTTENGSSGWVANGRLTYRTEDVTVAGLVARARATDIPGEGARQIEGVIRRSQFVRSTFAADLHVLLWELRHAAMLADVDSRPAVDASPLLSWLGSRLRLEAPERFAAIASRSPHLDAANIRRLETTWTPACGDGCLFTMAGSLRHVLADSSLIPFLIEAVRSAESAGYVVSLNALRTLGTDLEAAAFRAAMDEAHIDRAIAAARVLHDQKDSAAVWWVRRALDDPDRSAVAVSDDGSSPLLALAVEFGIAAPASRLALLDRSAVFDTLPPSKVWRIVAETLHRQPPPDLETVAAIIRALEHRPQHWVTLVNQVVGTAAMTEPDLRDQVSAVALRLLHANADSVQVLAPGANVRAWHDTGVLFASHYPSAAMVPGIIATLADPPPVDAYQASTAFVRRQQVLVQLTAEASAPFFDYPSAEKRDSALAFWSGWWDKNGGRWFKPASRNRAAHAVRNWREPR